MPQGARLAHLKQRFRDNNLVRRFPVPLILTLGGEVYLLGTLSHNDTSVECSQRDP